MDTTTPDAGEPAATGAAPQAPDSLATTERASRDKLTTSVGQRLEPTEQKPSFWKRLFGKG
jgi:hypothetical protein